MDALAHRHTIRHLVATFQQTEAAVRQAFASLCEAQTQINAVFSLGSDHTIRIDASRDGYRDDFDDADRAVERMARDAWAVIVDRLELRRMMSIERFRRLEKQLKEGPLPPITEEAVVAFVAEYAASIPEMAEEAAAEVFEWLRPHGQRYKTNSELEIGPRVVLSGMVELGWSSGGGRFRVRYHRQQPLLALENVLSALDGAGMIAKGHYSALEMAINESKTGVVETAYLKARCCKNGNMHLEFRRLDLLARFNRMAGGKRLRPAA